MARHQATRVTLKDIAQRCGYTINTVSRAMRNDEKLPLTTREKIRATAKEMGYIHNSVAATLRLGTSHMVAVIVNNVQNPYFSVALSRMDACLRAAGYNMMILCTQEDERLATQMLRVAISQSVDGVLYTPYSNKPEHIEYLQKNHMPFVLVDRRMDGIAADNARCDDEAGGYLAGRHLLELGHKKFVYMAGDVISTSQIDRQKGLQRAFSEAGVPAENLRIIRWPEIMRAMDENTMRSLLFPADYTAVVTFNDEIASYVLNTFRESGLRVPEDVSLMSFDHICASLPYFSKITSVAQVSGNIAQDAVRFLLNRIQDPSLPPQIHVLPVRVYDEGTTAPPRTSGPLHLKRNEK